MKHSDQKRRILLLAQMFMQLTDSEHLLSTQDIIAGLDKEGILCERKTVYDDIEALRLAGMDITQVKGRPGGYYLSSRRFELAELKLLVDAVQACRSISPTRSVQLIKKLQSLTGKGEANKLARTVLITGRAKTPGDNLFYSIDTVYDAISSQRCITFLYCDYGVDKQLHPRRNGERYSVSPCLLCWDDENYYLVAYHPRYNRLAHFRVDKMRDIRLTDEPCRQIELNPAEYARRSFGMFAGDAARVELTLPERYLSVVIDRFGTGIFITREREGIITVQLDVALSPVFFSWVFMLEGAKITYPAEVAEQYTQYLRTALAVQEDET